MVFNSISPQGNKDDQQVSTACRCRLKPPSLRLLEFTLSASLFAADRCHHCRYLYVEQAPDPDYHDRCAVESLLPIPVQHAGWSSRCVLGAAQLAHSTQLSAQLVHSIQLPAQHTAISTAWAQHTAASTAASRLMSPELHRAQRLPSRWVLHSESIVLQGDRGATGPVQEDKVERSGQPNYC